MFVWLFFKLIVLTNGFCIHVGRTCIKYTFYAMIRYINQRKIILPKDNMIFSG